MVKLQQQFQSNAVNNDQNFIDDLFISSDNTSLTQSDEESSLNLFSSESEDGPLKIKSNYQDANNYLNCLFKEDPLSFSDKSEQNGNCWKLNDQSFLSETEVWKPKDGEFQFLFECPESSDLHPFFLDETPASVNSIESRLEKELFLLTINSNQVSGEELFKEIEDYSSLIKKEFKFYNSKQIKRKNKSSNPKLIKTKFCKLFQNPFCFNPFYEPITSLNDMRLQETYSSVPIPLLLSQSIKISRNSSKTKKNKRSKIAHMKHYQHQLNNFEKVGRNWNNSRLKVFQELSQEPN
jgi:hypothetical protein